MTDRKISELPAATLPLTGAELVPLVQGVVTEFAPASAFTFPIRSTLITVSQTFSLDPRTSYIRMVLVGGGAGGSPGARQATTSGRCGGGGGQPGACIDRFVAISSLASRNLVVNIGVGGIGGAAATSDNSTGVRGSDGGATTIICEGTTIATARRGISGGQGGTTDLSGFASTAAQFPGGGTVLPIYHNFGAAGRVSNGNIGQDSAFAPGSGGGGAGQIGGSTSSTSGGRGGSLPLVISDGGGFGVGSTGNGGHGSGFVLDGLPCGGGGAGGGYVSGAPGGRGGDGGLYGGGGGGGGASDNGFLSGAGGNGAPGAVLIVEFF